MPKSAAGDKAKNETERPPDGGYGWFIVFGAAITHFFVVGTARSLGVVYEDLRDKFGGTASQTAWVAAIFNTSRSIVAPLCGMLCKRLSCRTVTVLGGVVMCIGFVLSAFANSLFYLYVTFGISGVGGAMVFTPAYIMVGNYFDKSKGKAMALATIGSGLGSIVIAPLITGLIYLYAFSGTMIILAGIQLHNLVAGALYRPLELHKLVTLNKEDMSESKNDKTKDGEEQLGSVHVNSKSLEAYNCNEKEMEIEIKKPEEEPSGKLVEQNETQGKDATDISKEKAIDPEDVSLIINENLEERKKFRKCKVCSSNSLYRNCTFYVYGYLVMSMQVCIQSFLIFLPGYTKEKGVGDAGAAVVLSIFGFADMVGRFIFGFLFDLKYVSTRRRDFYCIVSGLFGLCAMSLTFMRNFMSVCVMSALTAIFEGATHSQRATVLSDFIPKSQMASAVGLIIFCQGLGNIWGPPFAGFLSDVSGTNAYGFIFCGSVMCSAALVFFIEKRLCRYGRNIENS